MQPSVVLMGQLGLMWHAAALKYDRFESAEKKDAHNRALAAFKRDTVNMMKEAEPDW